MFSSIAPPSRAFRFVTYHVNIVNIEMNIINVTSAYWRSASVFHHPAAEKFRTGCYRLGGGAGRS
jgi:hypothetical protein